MMAYVHPRPGSGRSPQRVSSRPGRDAWVAAAFLVLCLLLGGSSRFQLLPHLTLRLVSVVAIGVGLWRMSAADRALAKPFVLAVIMFGALMAIQLLPLPPALWGVLPGHDFYQDALTKVGLDDRWRPGSMTPDLTLNSMLALLPALAAALLFAPLDGAGRRLMADTLLMCLVASLLVAVLQLAVGAFYLYPRNNEGTGVGFFANRNHQALFLAIGVVIVFGRWRLGERPGKPAHMLLALVAAAVLLPFLVITGSRAGLAAGLGAFVVGGLVFARGILARQARWLRLAVPIGGVVMLAAVFAIGLVTTRQVAVQRLLQTGATLGTTELRTANLPAMMDMAWSFFPLGSGFGSFDAVFRRFESDALLRPTFFNHAHSEPIELLIEGGLPAVLMALAALVWFARRMPILAASARSPVIIRAQVGVLGLSLVLLGSLVDYPARTPFLSVVTVLLVTWASGRERGDEVVLGTQRTMG